MGDLGTWVAIVGQDDGTWAAALARIGPVHVSLDSDEPITRLQMDISQAI